MDMKAFFEETAKQIYKIFLTFWLLLINCQIVIEIKLIALKSNYWIIFELNHVWPMYLSLKYCKQVIIKNPFENTLFLNKRLQLPYGKIENNPDRFKSYFCQYSN